MANEMGKNLLDLFWRLPSINSSERITAEVSIIEILKQKQTLVANDCSKELQYTLGRLIKGVASSRGAARLGFATTLTGILRTFSQISIEDILEKTNKFLKIDGTPKEQLNAIFGRLLVYLSLIVSKRILEDENCLTQVFTDLEKLRARKCFSNLYLQAIIQILDIIDIATFETKMWPYFENEFSQGWAECRIDQVVILLECSRHFPTLINKSFFKKNWGCKKIICSDTLTSLQRILGEVSTEEKYGLYLLLQHLAINESIKIFNLFWNNVINKGLLQSTNQNKTYLVFELIEKILPILSVSSQVETVLSEDAMMQIKKAYENEKNILNSASVKLVKSFISALNSNVKESVAICLMEYIAVNPLCPITAFLTQFNNMKDIISLLSNDQLIAYESSLRKLYLGILYEWKGENPKARIFAITKLSQLFMLQNTYPQRQKSIMKFLLLHSQFHLQQTSKTILHCDEIPQDDISVDLRNITKNAFNKVMESIASKSRLQTSNDFLYSLIFYIEEILQNTNIMPLFSWDEDVKDEWNKMLSTVLELHENTPQGIKHDHTSAFEVLFLSMAIQLLIEPKETLEVLQDLHVCYVKASDKIQKTCLEEDEPNWIEVVVDLLLSLLSRSKRALRCVVSSVFRLLAPFVTLSSLQLILDAINPEKGFDNESDDESNSGDSISSNESDSEDNMQVDEVFKNKLQVALGNAIATSDQESDLSDNAMFELDDKLSEVFQENLGNKKQSKETLHFNNRCLELINIYISNHPKINLTLELIQPLFTIIDNCRKNPDYKIMQDLTCSILKKMCKIRKFDDPSIESDTSCIIDQLKVMVLKSQCIEDHSVVELFENASMFIVFCLQHSNSNMEDVIINIFEVALQEFLDRSHCQNLTVLNGFIQRYSNIAWKLHKVLVKFSFSFEVKVFKRMMICNVFSELCSRITNISVKQWKKMCLLLSANLPAILNKAVEENKKGYLQALFVTIHNIFLKKQFKEISLNVLKGSLDIFESVLPKLSKKEAHLCKLFIGKLKPQNNQEKAKKRKKNRNLQEKVNLDPALLLKVKKIKKEIPKIK